MSMFSQWKARELKWDLKVPWMSEAEAGAFKMLRAEGEVSTFRTQTCQGAPPDADGEPVPCTKEVPTITDDQGQQAKRYCSRVCHDSKVPQEDP